MENTVDNIPYLCCVSQIGHVGIKSYEYQEWLKKQECKSDEEYIEKYIPLKIRNVYLDIDMLSLPRIFRTELNPRGKLILDRINSFKQKVAMDISFNYKYNLALVL